MTRDKRQRDQDRADLLAALAEAERPITAPALVAQARGYTLESIPDRVLDLALRRASTDLLALVRAGALVLNTPGFVATYTRVDLPGSELAGRLADISDRWPKAETPHWVADGAGDPIEVGGHCGLHVDLQLEAQAPMRGDWVATEAGSRYLVDDVRLVRSAKHRQVKRYQLTVLRLPKDTDPPEDVHVIWLTWYPRARSRR